MCDKFVVQKGVNLEQDLCHTALMPLIMTGCEFSPTSGSEIEYDPKLWENDKIKNSTTCFSYVINKSDGFDEYKGLDVGMISGELLNIRIPEEIIRLLFSDIKNLGGEIIPISFKKKCPSGFYKIALVFKPNDINRRRDFHFYRENPDGTWSHKTSRNDAINTDKDNKKIINPKTANRGDYSVFVGYYAIKNIDWKDEKINTKVAIGYKKCWDKIIESID